MQGTPAWSYVGAKTALDFVLVHQLRKSDQQTDHLELLVQPGSGQLIGLRCVRSGTYKNLVEICKKSNTGHLFPCKFSPHKSVNSPGRSGACVFFRVDSIDRTLRQA